MKLTYLSTKDVKKLLEQCKLSLGHYKSANLLSQHLDNETVKLLESTYDLPELPKLHGTIARDAESAINLHKWIKRASPEIPRSVLCDGRLWTALCHFTFRDYMLERWPLNTDTEEAVAEQSENKNSPQGYGTISGRFFVIGNGQRGIVRNGLARLFWAAELSVTNGDYSLVDTMFIKQDVHASIVERSLSADKDLTQKILIALKQCNEADLSKKDIQLFAKLINGAGSTRTLETVAKRDVDYYKNQVFEND